MKGAKIPIKIRIKCSSKGINKHIMPKRNNKKDHFTMIKTIIKKSLWGVLGLLLCLFFFSQILGGYYLSAKGYQGTPSDHFDGRQFLNAQPFHHGFADFWRWRFTRDKKNWPKWVNLEPGPTPPAWVKNDSLRVTFINHATVLLQFSGLNILTDPIWSERASPFKRFGPKRVKNPGLTMDQLPLVHAILISHNHYDSMDLKTLRILQDRDNPKIYVGLGNAQYLNSKGINNAVDLDWGEIISLNPEIKLICVPSRHFSSRGLWDRDQTLWNGFVLQSPSGSIYFVGDSGYGHHFEEIGKRYGPFRLALIPIGAYEPRWFMKGAHINPEESVRVHKDVRAKTSLAIHFGTFQLTDEGINEPRWMLEKELSKNKENQSIHFITLENGEFVEIP
jgi:L-ascorbate metabolism protein UlaG (beta-lactamase superfamily)